LRTPSTNEATSCSPTWRDDRAAPVPNLIARRVRREVARRTVRWTTRRSADCQRKCCCTLIAALDCGGQWRIIISGGDLSQGALMDKVEAGTRQLGVSRPPLTVEDLPEPEQVFGVRRIGPRELFMYALGPSLIALGISIGSGEWLLGPQAVGQFGFVGIGWVILISALLQ